MVLLVVLGVVYGLLLLLWVLTALPALIAAIPGEFAPAAMVVPWGIVIVGWLGIPVSCVIALDALVDGVLDGRSLLPPLAFGVMLAGVGLGVAGWDSSSPAHRRATPASGPSPTTRSPSPDPAWARCRSAGRDGGRTW